MVLGRLLAVYIECVNEKEHEVHLRYFRKAAVVWHLLHILQIDGADTPFFPFLARGIPIEIISDSCSSIC